MVAEDASNCAGERGNICVALFHATIRNYEQEDWARPASKNSNEFRTLYTQAELTGLKITLSGGPLDFLSTHPSRPHESNYF